MTDPLSLLALSPRFGPTLRRIVFIWLALLCLSASCQELAAEPTIVRYFSKGNTEGLRTYQLELVKLLLEKTRATHGDYSLIIVDSDLSAARAKAETEKGELINTHYATEWSGEFVNAENVYVLPHSVLKGLLGMRSLIVREDRLQDFEHIDQHNQLSLFKAGQRTDWPDVEILKYNKLPTLLTEQLTSLSPMLQAHRFDYLPLSILEAPAVTVPFNTGSNALAISPSTAIFYPLAMHLCVSKTKPKIAERLGAGLTIASEDGSIDALFEKHFGFIAVLLAQRKLTTLILNNPLISPSENKRLIAEFINNYGPYTKTVYVE
ncbi:hypothetical protein KO528_07855 [Saccharophagus degradans]|uniref:Uncharacterized protein n=1 Tax=Saccharophagus degradans TaxID=86304 RepID=A0AAW7XAD3_9GAMM|nr:hypothetical protein [Saccharophagus degradans]MBU2985262.1 hypothetical protein [Saccharophagus degradans]MDO6424454.1 hypothetical protein [Saccharophagus degradans]MDO6608339.1 hypothetical protein [Saccharophagus degradans]